jgi:hypothetical protein
LTLKRPQRVEKESDASVKPNSSKPNKVASIPPPRAVPTDGELLAALQAVAPGLWDPRSPMPLAIGIHKQLYPVAERMQTSRRALRAFLSRWTSSNSYQGALAQPGASRFNLDGSQAGAVSQQHGDRARQLTTPD